MQKSNSYLLCAYETNQRNLVQERKPSNKQFLQVLLTEPAITPKSPNNINEKHVRIHQPVFTDNNLYNNQDFL